MCSRGLRTSLLGVVVGAATVESMTLTARSGGVGFLRTMVVRSSCQTSAAAKRTMSMSVDAGVDAARYTNFIKDKVRRMQDRTHSRESAHTSKGRYDSNCSTFSHYECCKYGV